MQVRHLRDTRGHGGSRVTAPLFQPFRQRRLGERPSGRALGTPRRQSSGQEKALQPFQNLLLWLLGFPHCPHHFTQMPVPLPLASAHLDTVGLNFSCTPVTWDWFTNRMFDCLLTLPLLLWRWLLRWHHPGLWWSTTVSWWVWRSLLSKLWVDAWPCH
jgi:hypothetical protein